MDRGRQRSKLFPFPHPDHGNITRKAEFSSHKGEKDLVKVRWEGGRSRAGRNAALVIFSGKVCSVCVLHCLPVPLAKATKGSIYLS